MSKNILIKQISFCSVCKLLSLGLTTSVVLFTCISAIFHFFTGVYCYPMQHVFMVNNVELAGKGWFVINIFMNFIAICLFSFVIGLFVVIGIYFYTKLSPISIDVQIVEEKTENQD